MSHACVRVCAGVRVCAVLYYYDICVIAETDCGKIFTHAASEQSDLARIFPQTTPCVHPPNIR